MRVTVKRPSITTRVGDRGRTRIFSGEWVSKDSPRTHAYGDLDELVSLLGVARAHARKKVVRDRLLKVQRELFIAGSELATARRHGGKLPRRVDGAMAAALDADCAKLEASFDAPRDFVVPGASAPGSFIDWARAVARRCERRVAGLSARGLVSNRHLLVWMNRLSDYLWLLARLEEGRATPLRRRGRGRAQP